MKQIFTQKLNAIMFVLLLCGATFTSQSYAASPTVAAMAGSDENEDAYAALSAKIAEWQATLSICSDEVTVLAQVLGSSFAGQYGYQIAMIQQSISSAQSQLESDYAAGTLTSESTLQNAETIEGNISSLKSSLEGQIAQQSSTIMQTAMGTINQGLGSRIGSLQMQINAAGKAEEYADRMAALTEKRNEASAKVNEYVNSINAAETPLEKMQIAVELNNYYKEVQAEIEAEVAAIQAELANEAAYATLSAKIDEWQAALSVCSDEVTVLAQVLGGSFAGQYGYQIAMIQQSINVAKGQLESDYAAGTLTSESTLQNAETIEGNISSLKSSLEGQIAQQSSTIMQTAMGTINQGLGSRIGSLQMQINAAGKAEEYADRMAALTEKRNEASAKVNEYVNSINAAETPLEKMQIAVELNNYYKEVQAEIEAEIAAIQAELEKGTGIETLNVEESLANGVQVYDLNGRRVSNPTNGLYIIGGKKVMIKR